MKTTIQKTLLASAVAVAMAVVPMTANATWNQATNVLVVSQALATTHDDLASGNVLVYTSVTGESLAANDTVTLTLTGGATFDGTTGVTMTPNAGDLGGGDKAAAAPLSGGTAGSTTATWRVVAGVVAGSTLTLNSTATIFDVSGVSAGTQVDATLAMATSTGLQIRATRSVFTDGGGVAPADSIFTGVNLATVTNNSPQTDISRVAAAYRFFDNAGTDVTTTPARVEVTPTAAAIPNTTIAAATLVYTLTGDFSGVTSITGTGLTGSDVLGVQTGGVANTFIVDAANGAAYASNTAAKNQGSGAFDIADLTMTVDGVTTQSARVFNLTINKMADASYSAHTVRAASPIATITRDGTFFTTNSTGPLNNVKITDLSGSLTDAGGAVTVSAFDAAGVTVAAAAGAPALVATVPNNGTVTMTGSDLIANFPDAVRFDVTVNSSDASISNVKKSTTGMTVTNYRSGAVGGSL
jgi:hypothetical protein